ncbi:MAG: ABC transporter permease, partial [Clostridiales bacterium]|nr:ABC transporter permease [Clostridiales bacterium]
KYGVAEHPSLNGLLMALEGIKFDDSFYYMMDEIYPIYIIMAILIVVISACSIVVIANGFNISFSERVRQFGLLKSVGATGGQIRRSVLFEALILGLIAIPLGILAGFALEGGALLVLNTYAPDTGLFDRGGVSDFRLVFNPLALLITAAVALATALFSAWRPARRAGKMSAIDAIRQSGEIYVRDRELKTPEWTQRVFGFEGTLASKALKRSRGKYRATVVSLVVGVVLFISIYSFVEIATRNMSAAFTKGSHNIRVEAWREPVPPEEGMGDWGYRYLGFQDEVETWLAQRDDLTFLSRRYIYGGSAGEGLPESFLSERLLSYSPDSYDYPIIFYAIPDAEFAKLAPGAQGAVPGVLVNSTGLIQLPGDKKFSEFAPFSMNRGLVLTLASGVSVTLAAQMRERPAFISSSWEGYVEILIPASVFHQLALDVYGETSANAHFLVTAKTPRVLVEELWDQFKNTGKLNPDFNVYDLESQWREQRATSMLISLIGYGFIAVISLIAATSVIATISTGMALRRREFAMLYSNGMTARGMTKMINLESLLYGLKALSVGLPLGLGINFALYAAFKEIFDVPYRLPLNALLISCAAVLLLTYATMRYSQRKLKNVSIVEAIRSETV